MSRRRVPTLVPFEYETDTRPRRILAALAGIAALGIALWMAT